MKMTFDELRTIYETLETKGDKTPETSCLMDKALRCMWESFPEETAYWEDDRKAEKERRDLDAVIEEYVGTVKEVAIKKIVDELNENYVRLYNDEIQMSERLYDSYIDDGDDYIRENPVFVGHIVKARMDFISSDREVVALMLTVERNKKFISDIFGDELNRKAE